VASISACHSGSFPATVEDTEEEDASNNEPTASDIPFDIEKGDRVWATGLIPKAQYVQATSTISQRLAEGFARNLEANPTLPTGGSRSKNPIPDYVKIFGQVFSEEGFAKLPNRKPWDHAIDFLTENLETGHIRQSKSPMASPVFFIKKKDGSLRLVQDYRMLNDMMVKNKYPLLLISELVNQL
jgi:hypothetical protein